MISSPPANNRTQNYARPAHIELHRAGFFHVIGLYITTTWTLIAFLDYGNMVLPILAHFQEA